ncbi:MAG: hypothetical protein IPK26_15370 [Planctomycetes bacterium]|nr:hypothetical protein [Planctomycetota bacterium]
MLRSLRPCSLLCLLLAGCGGGGGGGSPPPSVNEARLVLIGGELPAGQEQLAVTIRCDQLPQSGAVLIEAVLDPGSAFSIATARAPLQAIRTQPTVDGDVVSGSFKVVYGDGKNRAAQPLVAGEWFQVWLQVKSPRPTGSARVTLRDLRLVDADGATVPLASAPVFTDVTIR